MREYDENGKINSQGLAVDGGGEKKGIVVGIEGIVVGKGGSVGMVGNVGIGREGIWVLGKGGNVGFGKVGAVGSVGREALGNGGNVAVGRVGSAGNGGSIALGRGGIVSSVGAAGGEVCNREYLVEVFNEFDEM
ncbi:hypothetical protein F0562_015235 [Nyssa sinensis]|uniref:Uncharacterized protein n=1 Tax=Nyssa sinensis TaxID=561372 RepID=A0A5J4ZGU2_9ASTE|nr:hypothetical protein F0562_015235 [Nyssa sinensis]